MTRCPCCLRRETTADLVTCWPCYRGTDRLTPGTYNLAVPASGPYDAPGTITVAFTAMGVEAWTAERDRRLGRPAMATADLFEGLTDV